jgi:hypothetical protein
MSDYKFKTWFSVLEKKMKEKREMGKWSRLELVNVLDLDTNKNRIVVYSQIIQLFEIIEYQPRRE